MYMMKAPHSGVQGHTHWALAGNEVLTRALLKTMPVFCCMFLSLGPVSPSLHRRNLGLRGLNGSHKVIGIWGEARVRTQKASFRAHLLPIPLQPHPHSKNTKTATGPQLAKRVSPQTQNPVISVPLPLSP